MLADGSIGGFSAMETDFNITLQVSDLTNESDLGEWIVKVMQVIENIPPEQIVGPRPGRVSIIFQSNGDQKAVNFYVNQYQALAAGIKQFGNLSGIANSPIKSTISLITSKPPSQAAFLFLTNNTLFIIYYV